MSRWGRRFSLEVAGLPLAIGLVAGLHQTVGQADLQIKAIEVIPANGYLSVKVLIYSENGDNARNAALHLFLPVGARVARLSPGCLPSPSQHDSAQARVDCALGQIRVRDAREVIVVASPPAPGIERRFAAFVYSDTPDPKVTNNYAERVLP